MLPLEALKVAKSWGMLSNNEIYAIRFMALIMPQNATCVNIGAGTGTSSMAFIEARPDLAPKFWTVDNTIESPFGGLQNEKNCFEKTNLQLPNQILGDSAEIDYRKYMNLTNPVFDYVFIDGDHSYEHCIKDFYNIYKYCRYGTIVAFHDYNNPDKNCIGVQPAVDKIIIDTKSDVFLHVDFLMAIKILSVK